jgi:hypothetical protein
MIADISGGSGIPQIIALGIVAVVFVTILFRSSRSRSQRDNKS